MSLQNYSAGIYWVPLHLFHAKKIKLDNRKPLNWKKILIQDSDMGRVKFINLSAQEDLNRFK
jgi:hypothetical protein